MISFRKESDEVLYPVDEVVTVDLTDVTELKKLALLNPRKRVRLCSHASPGDSLHEMFIIHTRDTYVRPHKHTGKSESFSILEGEVDVVLFHDNGEVQKVIRMGDPQSGLPFYYRLSTPIFHTLLIRSEVLVFLEVTQGPFRREQTIFADWAKLDLNIGDFLDAKIEDTIAQIRTGK